MNTRYLVRDRVRSLRPRPGVIAAGLLSLCVAGCGGDSDTTPSAALACDDGLKAAFKPDANTSVILVRKFAKGDDIKLEGTPVPVAPATHVKAAVDMCLVKLVIGPGKSGPVGAPSTSPGIGIEVWLPPALSSDPTQHAWNEIVRAYGSGGWGGGYQADVRNIGNGGGGNTATAPGAPGNLASHIAAVGKGYAVSTSDMGHAPVNNGSFTLHEDGSINTVLWQDFAERSTHEQAEKTKALVKLYYGKAHKYAYWDGFSTGGRQGYKLAQKYPDDFDGILAGAPSFNWSKFITNELYPQLVMERDLGGPIPAAKLNAVSAAANAACGGSTLGFQIDPLACRYNPRADASMLCSGQPGVGVTGTSTAATCLSAAEALAMNKIWYGQTRDGTVPDPAVDNAGASTSLSGNHLWFGLPRGTNLTALAGSSVVGGQLTAVPFAIASAQVALELLDPSYAQSIPAGTLTNSAGANLGQDRWKTLSYADLGRAYDQGLSLQSVFSNINSDAADLSRLRDRGAKVMSYHGLADQLIMPQGSINYFERVAAGMGGISSVQQFNRLYLIPGLAHDGTFATSASIDPATGANASANKVPMPQPSTGRDELFAALRAWVENGQAPGRIDVSSADASVTMPICVYPLKAVQTGPSATSAASYACQ